MSRSRKLTPSKKVFERMRWDPAFSTDGVVVVYEDRFSGAKERAFADFAPERVPWSRVVQFRRGTMVLWDRRTRIDRIFGSGDTPAEEVLGARKARRSPKRPARSHLSDLRETAPYCYHRERNRWEPVQFGDGHKSAPARASSLGSQIELVTFNVLHDLYDEGQLHSQERVPILLAALADADADVIGLQEITPAVARALMDQPWVRERYYLSVGPEASTVTPYGLMLLSRAPIAQLALLQTGQRVYALLADVALGQNGEKNRAGTLRIALVHLTSDRHPRASTVRESQLNNILSALRDLPTSDDHDSDKRNAKNRSNASNHRNDEQPGAPESILDLVLMGDCNFGDEHVEPGLQASGLLDIWTVLHAGSPGFTFDPERNAIAQVNTISGQRRRLDRIFLRATGYRARAIALLDPRDLGTGMPASDHFGLRATLVASGEDAQTERIRDGAGPEPEPVPESGAPDDTAAPLPTHRSALALLPAPSNWPAIQAIRARHDRSFERWMPHINLIYGFWPESHFTAALPAVRSALADIRPFPVELTELRCFHHRRSDTIWLHPVTAPEDALRAVQAALTEAFPGCDEQSQKSPAGFTAHLSIGQVRGRDRRRIDELIAEWQAAWQPQRFVAGAVCLISRRGDEPFAIRHIVPFGGDSLADTVNAIRAPWSASWSIEKSGSRAGADLGAPATIEAVTELVCASASAEQSALRAHVVGSARMYPDSRDVDIALIDSQAQTGVDALTALTPALAQHPDVHYARLLHDATVPVVRVRIGGREVDIMCARGPAGGVRTPLAQWTESDQFARLPDADQRVVSAVLLADWLEQRSVEFGPVFVATVRALRTWTRARALDRQAHGYLGGVSWALLAARAFAESGAAQRPLAPAERLADVLDYLASALATARRSSPTGVIEVASPVAPYENTARTLLPATTAQIVDELERATVIVSDIAGHEQPWSALFEAVDRWRHRHYALVEICGESPGDVRAALGWLDSRALGFVTDIAHLPSCQPRPYPVVIEPASGPSSGPQSRLARRAHWLCGLDPRENDPDASWSPPTAVRTGPADKLQRGFARWPDRPSACTLLVTICDRASAQRSLLPQV